MCIHAKCLYFVIWRHTNRRIVYHYRCESFHWTESPPVLTLRKIAICLSKNCQKIYIFFQKNCHWQFFGKNEKFWQFFWPLDNKGMASRPIMRFCQKISQNDNTTNESHARVAAALVTTWWPGGDLVASFSCRQPISAVGFDSPRMLWEHFVGDG